MYVASNLLSYRNYADSQVDTNIHDLESKLSFMSLKAVTTSNDLKWTPPWEFFRDIHSSYYLKWTLSFREVSNWYEIWHETVVWDYFLLSRNASGILREHVRVLISIERWNFCESLIEVHYDSWILVTTTHCSVNFESSTTIKTVLPDESLSTNTGECQEWAAVFVLRCQFGSVWETMTLRKVAVRGGFQVRRLQLLYNFS